MHRAHPNRASIVEPAAPSATCRLGRRYDGSILDALSTSAAHLWGSGGLLFVQHLSSSVRRQAHGRPMVPDAHEVVQAAVDGLRATCSISWQRPVAMGWSTDLASAPTCTVEEPMRTSQHRRKTGCRSSPACRCESCTPPGTLQLMCPAASEPLSSRARPLEAWRARGRPRQPPWLVRRSSFRGPYVKRLINLFTLNREAHKYLRYFRTC